MSKNIKIVIRPNYTWQLEIEGERSIVHDWDQHIIMGGYLAFSPNVNGESFVVKVEHVTPQSEIEYLDESVKGAQ